ncbi:MAG: DUF2889 domain-containing protein, partial [Acidimicrobiia bacterium]|nr:DUF2889 domain-containing protein [Acidimicrobiia bacterium]
MVLTMCMAVSVSIATIRCIVSSCCTSNSNCSWVRPNPAWPDWVDCSSAEANVAQPTPNPHPILPDNPEYLPIHTRNYEVRAFKVSDSEILLWGAVRDDKPAGMYVMDDPEPLTIHHMVVQLRVSFPMMEILDASAELKEFPHQECPGIG